MMGAPRRRLLRRGILTAAWLSAMAVGHAALPAPGLHGQQGSEPEVKRVRFRGNEAFSDEALAISIVTRETECPLWLCAGFLPTDRNYLNRRELPRDLARIKFFYFQRGYREAEVDTTVVQVDSATVEVIFDIQEGRPIRVGSVEFNGLDRVQDTAGLRSDLPLEVGDPLNLLELNATRDTMTSRLKNAGYARAEVFRGYRVESSEPYQGRVILDLYPGPKARFGPVSVEGAATLTPTVVRRMLPFQEGDPYSQATLFQGQRNLFGLEIIRHANLQGDFSSQPDTLVPVLVEVNEGDIHRVRGGLEWNTTECMATEARWTSRNFFGGGRRLQLTGRVSNLLTQQFREVLCPQAGTGSYGDLNWLVSADFSQPWVFSSRNALTAAVYAERTSIPDIFIRRALGLNTGWVRTTSHGSLVTFSYRPQRVALDAAEVYFCAAFLVCDPEDIDLFQEPNLLSPVGVNYFLDRTDEPLNPSGGFLLNLDYELAGRATLSDYQYQRLSGSYSQYAQVSSRIVLAGRIRAGVVTAGRFDRIFVGDDVEERIIHPEKRFFSGGANSVRGFAQNDLGPQNLTVGVQDLITPSGGRPNPVCTPESILDLSCDANGLGDGEFDRPVPVGGTLVAEANFEARIEAWGASQVAVFTDVGQVWAETGDFDFADLEWTPGVGLRILTPIGPLRLDVAYNFRGTTPKPVITEQIRLAEESDPSRNTVVTPDGRRWVVTDALAILDPLVRYPTEAGEDLPLLSWRRFQLHFSIGQAF